jgi:hypothetical protein
MTDPRPPASPHWQALALSADRSPESLVELLGTLHLHHLGLERMAEANLYVDPRQRVILQEEQ